ncbi:peptidase inhibitor family I36 protein [Pyxidicoccus sp. 3LG]
MYEHDNFSGASLTKTADDASLVDDSWNDKMSSLIVSASGM